MGYAFYVNNGGYTEKPHDGEYGEPIRRTR